MHGSLKQHTRDRKTGKTTPVHYIVNDSTEIKNMKVFLAHIKTKAELTSYLSEKVLQAYREKKKKVVLMHHTQVEVNCPLDDVIGLPSLKAGRHSLEEGDQLVLLNAVDVKRKCSDVTLDIFSVDTDVLVILIGYYLLLPTETFMIRKIRIANLY